MSKISDLAAHCIRCGFCLESCPTFVVTGKESESPRGRIYLIRAADEGTMPWEAVYEHIDLCVGCRACETSCPSAVQYGELLELGRQQIEEKRSKLLKKAMLSVLTRPELLKAQLALSRLLPRKRVPRLLSRESSQVDLPVPQPADGWPALDPSQLPPLKGEVCVLAGCAVDTLFARVQAATVRLLRRAGYGSRLVHGCCGALHAHNGYLDQANAMARRIEQSARSCEALVSNSAGCGSFLKEATGLPVKDLSEFLFEVGFVEVLERSPALNLRATYHDACHLAHGQKITTQPRSLGAAIPGVDWLPLAEADMCCGSGGIYNLTQPSMARTLLDRKWQNVMDTGAQIVVSGNPGCHSWLEQASREHGRSVVVAHTAELLEAAFSGPPGDWP